MERRRFDCSLESEEKKPNEIKSFTTQKFVCAICCIFLCFISFTKSNLQSQSIVLCPAPPALWTTAVFCFCTEIISWFIFNNCHSFDGRLICINWLLWLQSSPGISCIRNRTSRSLLAHCQLYWAGLPDIVVGWVGNAAVQETLYSFLWLFIRLHNRKPLSATTTTLWFDELQGTCLEGCYSIKILLKFVEPMVLSGKKEAEKIVKLSFCHKH